MKLFTKVLVVALVVSCHLSLAGASMIDEISVDSVDTVFRLSPGSGTLTIAQTGVNLLLERSDNTQQTITDVDFSLVTFLSSDNSSGGQAMADFAGGTISITDASGTLLTAHIDGFSVEEALNLPFSLVVGSGNFTVTGGYLSSEFGPSGVIFDVTWELDRNIDDFTQDFAAESDVTLTPEPATVILLAVGGLFVAKHRRRHRR